MFSLLLLCSELHFLGGAGALGWGIVVEWVNGNHGGREGGRAERRICTQYNSFLTVLDLLRLNGFEFDLTFEDSKRTRDVLL